MLGGERRACPLTSGRFKNKSTEAIAGVASETVWFEVRFTSATKAVGTLRSQTVGGGETCGSL